MAGGLPVLRTVDELLRMLDAHAHGKGLAGHVRPGLANHLEGVTRGVPAGQHDAIGGEDFRRSRALIDEANGSDARFAIFAANLIHSISDARTISSSALKHKAVEAREEPYLSPGLLDGPTQVAHDATSRSVPMCGLASTRMSAGAPASTKASSTWRIWGDLIPVFSLPSENVPAPPSPNWMFVRSSSGAPA